MTHRPLADWVVPVRPRGARPVRWDPAAGVNDGDEQADARTTPEFASGWQRRRIELDLGHGALGLVHQESDRAVVELSETSRPIPVTAAGLTIIDRVEERWPQADLDAHELEVLGGEDVTLRHLLLSRLAAEGHPPPSLFHLLPWHLVTDLAGQVIATLQGAPSAPDVRLRHWFSVTGSRFTAALDQLAAGLRTADDVVARVGATALCTRLLDVEVPRVPEATREALRRLMGELIGLDPFLAFWARRVSRRLAGDGAADADDERSVRLIARLAPAADARGGIRRHARELNRAPFAVRLNVTSTGRLEAGVDVRLAPEQAAFVTDAYKVVVVPMELRDADGERISYLIPLQHVAGRLTGAVSVPAPPGEFRAEFPAPPIGMPEVRFLGAGDLARSLREVRTRTGLRPWQRLATALPEGHVLRSMVARAAGGRR